MEKAHDISLDEPCVAHQAILFMLDVLMRSQAPSLPLDELYDSFGDKSFTPQMLRAVGGNEQGLKAFLSRYPSLFTIGPGDMISANSGGSQFPPRLSTTPDRYLRNKNKSAKPTTPTPSGDQQDADSANSSTSSSSSSSGGGGTGAGNEQSSGSMASGVVYEQSKTMKEIEQEAIAFFRKQMSKREEDWLPIVSVAGHASQSSADIRKFVGPQNEFKSFLVKYPHIFIVRDEYCGLKGRADLSTQPFPPPSPPPKRRLLPASLIAGGLMSPQSQQGGLLSNISTPGVLTRTHSFKSSASASSHRYSACILSNQTNSLVGGGPSASPLAASLIHPGQSLMSPVMGGPGGALGALTNASNSSLGSSVTTAGGGPGAGNKPRLTAIEVRAVHYVMRILHKNGRMLLQTIPGLISRAPDQVSNVVGFTREDLIQFFKRHSAIFQLHPDGCVSVKQDAVKALILKDMSPPSGNVLGLGPGVHMNAMVNGAHNGGGGLTNGLMLNGGAVSSQNDIQPGIITNNGVVLRIFPKYGILNMENNEQVFFDIQSCQFETFNDLTTILHMGDRLYFNAVIGPRDGSTKWRSIKTWIKMKPQQQAAAFDNLSSHSDADKSDDSSTSSSHGMHLPNGGGPNNNGGGGGYSGRHHHSNLFYHNSFHGSFNGYNPSASPFQSATLSQFYLPQSSTPSTTASTPVATAAPSSASISNAMGGVGGGGVNNDDPMSVSTSNMSIVSSANTAVSVPVGQTGEFNQYQLDSNSTEFIPSAAMSTSSTATPSDPNTAAAGAAGDESATLSSSSMSSSQLIHSSSANNLANEAAAAVVAAAAAAGNKHHNQNHHMSTSKSIHSFSSSDDKASKSGGGESAASTGGVAVATTKLMKQSPDNISQKETITITVPVVATSTTKEMVSIGCQTISTGDITVTDVFIE